MGGAALLAGAWLLLAVCRPALAWFGVVTTLRAVFGSMARPRHVSHPAQIAELRRIVDIAARHSLAPTTCLTRSLVLGWFLRRRGIDAQLRIGVRLVGRELFAHAWLELCGVPLNEQQDVIAQYAVFDQPLPVRAFHAA